MSSEDASPDLYADPLVFGQRLQILRTRRGMTRDQLGGLLGKSGSWVKGIETGRLKTPKLETVLRIAELLRVRNLSDLTGDQSVHVDLFTGLVTTASPRSKPRWMPSHSRRSRRRPRPRTFRRGPLEPGRPGTRRPTTARRPARCCRT